MRQSKVAATGRAVLLDPPSAPRSAPAGRIFSDARERGSDQPAIGREIPALPDRQLVATLVALGCPAVMAAQIVANPQGRFGAVATWCLVQDANEGLMVQNARTGEWSSARDLVDAMREQYAQARKVQLISDRPDHTVGLWER